MSGTERVTLGMTIAAVLACGGGDHVSTSSMESIFETTRDSAICVGGDGPIYYFDDDTLMRHVPLSGAHERVAQPVQNALYGTRDAVVVARTCDPTPGGLICDYGLADVRTNSVSQTLFDNDLPFVGPVAVGTELCLLKNGQLSCRQAVAPWSPGRQVDGIAAAQPVGPHLLLLDDSGRLGILAPQSAQPVWSSELLVGSVWLLGLSVYDLANDAVIVRTALSAGRRLVRLGLDGQVEELLSTADLTEVEGAFPRLPWFAVAPGGQTLVVTDSAERRLVRFDLGGGGATVIASDVYSVAPLWRDPAGGSTKIAYVSREDLGEVGSLHLYDLATGSDRELSAQHDGHLYTGRIAVTDAALYYGAPEGQCTGTGSWPCPLHSIMRHDFALDTPEAIVSGVEGYFSLAVPPGEELVYLMADAGSSRRLQIWPRTGGSGQSVEQQILDSVWTMQDCGDCVLAFQSLDGGFDAERFAAYRLCADR